jgi:hypothetical protein
MIKWVLLLFMVVGGVLVWLNWPAVNEQLKQAQTQLSSEWNSGKMAVMQPDGSSETVSVPISKEAWSPRQVAGLQLNLPFDLQPITAAISTQVPAGVELQIFGGKSLKHEVVITHLAISMAGAMPLWAFNLAQGQSASRLGVEVIQQKPATLLNGFRVQRTDAVSKTSPKIRYRLLLIERANQAWFLETHSMDDGDDFEPAFQKMIFSVR